MGTNNQQKAINIKSALLASNTDRWWEAIHQWLFYNWEYCGNEWLREKPGAVQKQSCGKAGTSVQLFLLPFQS